ncbi:hypothetical protein SODALDRAFT_86943 [Sodiomyces alkalinus F11]|uniref:Uncharacterized protein n=1 Tax=Sodiomyces alkalinus (strain CBS 110278 / VKM F-3762 / F11) TaxID=1314773 RepID=A0A3N2PIX0_SODAK|nr:hypothetical protein SODALDRAFT_86943 [Sodiomyces alkalinus F11]ROT34489.1 hypothetical protein SODALDRAFT_86943 [Sodiomyces alkalinus F11]
MRGGGGAQRQRVSPRCSSVFPSDGAARNMSRPLDRRAHSDSSTRAPSRLGLIPPAPSGFVSLTVSYSVCISRTPEKQKRYPNGERQSRGQKKKREKRKEKKRK